MVLGLFAGLPLTDRLPDPAGGFELHVHRDVHVWSWAIAVAIAGELRRDLAQRPRSRLLISGSEAAIPAYHALSKAPLDWDRVDVGLTDERWLQPDDPDSKAAIIRRHLLTGHAAPARLEPVTQAGRRIEDAVAFANAHARQLPALIVLTLGDDGHVAGLFADAPDYAKARASRQAYVAFDASTSASAGPWPRRITATPAGLASPACRLLLIRGRAQRERFDAAMASGDAQRHPLIALHAADAGPIQTHWCP